MFNPGERVEGYTSPLWLALLAGVARLPVDLPRAAVLLGGILAAATLLLVVALGRGLVARQSLLLLAALSLATSPAYVYWGWSGMETALFTLLFLATSLLFVRRAPGGRGMALPGLLLALLALARPDGIVLLPAFLAGLALLHRREPRRLVRASLTLAAPLLLLVPHLLWRHAYYGSWVPNTYQAKAAIDPALLLRRGLVYCLEFLGTGAVLLLLGLIVIGLARRGVPAPPRLLALIALAWIGYVALVGGDHFPLHRFLVPVLPVLALAAVVALDRLLELPRVPGALPLAVAGLMLAANLAAYVSGGGAARMEVGRARGWAAAGRWLGRSLPADATIASLVVGAIPYHSGLRTVDLLGLTDAEVARHGQVHAAGRVGHQRYHTGYVLGRQPDCIVYPSSGRYAEPVYADAEAIPDEVGHALRELVRDPRTKALYQRRIEPIGDGTMMEMLCRRR